MSPSKRAGDTVDADQESATAPEDRPDGGSDGAAARAKPRRRSVVSSGTATPPERGSSSQRGSSSSTITKRGRFAEDDAEEPGPPEPPTAGTDRNGDLADQPDEVVVHDVVDPAPPPAAGAPAPPPPELQQPSAPLPVPPPPPPSARVDPGERRLLTGPDVEQLGIPVPITIPAGSPVTRQATTLTDADGPMAPPEPPYAPTTMTSHGVAPVPRVLGRRPRVRRVTRVVRHVDPWSVFKVSLVFNLVLYGVLLTAGVLLWNVAYATGTVDNLERFFESFGWTDFEFDGGAIYRASWIAGLFGVVGLTGATVLAATLFNLITDLVGGIRMTVLEEEVQERTQAPMRRFVVRRPSSSADPSAGLRREIDRLPVRDDPPSSPPAG